MAGTYRCTFTLPRDQAVLLANVAKRLGASQSSVLSILIEHPLALLGLGLGGDDIDVERPPARINGPHSDQLREMVFQAIDDGGRLGVLPL